MPTACHVDSAGLSAADAQAAKAASQTAAKRPVLRIPACSLTALSLFLRSIQFYVPDVVSVHVHIPERLLECLALGGVLVQQVPQIGGRLVGCGYGEEHVIS
jgi:hypothetical protein